MRVSYEWLTQYVDLKDISPEEIAAKMNQTGIEVEVIDSRDSGVSQVVVGEVLSTQQHPEADRLKVCLVHVGKGQQLQIVCGAPNVAKGQRVPVALVGAKLPGGMKIKKAKLRGIESSGMICSAKELGLPEKMIMKEQSEGILVLGNDAQIGEDIKDYLGLNDHVIELELTPNRSDCLGMIGVAYEIAAIFDRELRLPDVYIQDVEEGEGSEISIRLESEEDCPLYAAQVVHHLQLGTSPQWMQNRLIAAGIRPINNIVDVTNYVMMETGQPLHAFDYEKISSGQIVVRRACAKEQVVTLDGLTRTCDDEMLLITDGTQPLAIAGVMGGESSEVTEQTTSVLIESALFDPALVRKTSRKLGLRSEASSRFEKGADPERVLPALARAVQLLQQTAEGTVGSSIECEGLDEVEDMWVKLRHDRLSQVLGIQLEQSEVLDVFQRLRFEVELDQDTYKVQVPTRRPDITLEVDLIEEVARLYGYDKIPVTLPWGQQLPGGLTQHQKLRRVIRKTLGDLGLNEVITYSLTSPHLDEEIESLNPEVIPVSLALPMSNEHSVLRTTLLPHMIKVAEYNQNHGQERVAIFELGKTFLTDETILTKQPEERWELAGLLTGAQETTIWKKPEQEASHFYEAKGILEALFARLGLDQVQYREAFPVGYHPGRTAEMIVKEKVIGVFGQLHPKLCKKYDLEDTVTFQIDLAELFAAMNDELLYQPIPRFPAVTRDLAMIVDKEIPVGEIEEGIREAAGELLKSITLFDVFVGEQIGEGKKSVAYSLIYRAMDRTLTDEEIQGIHQGVVDHLESQFKAKLRQ
ncbi:phenylalanine--tRNA ligase subunit beta [Hazenella coriacea]|uniref:Phenylalanine--tRNA ligase beta subunit n=1 Tax=Hazenella coriacea TaxID=1179467 RepID=A0A4R3LAC4_9BACL|nr:phenylalanine--tRNA ligase subunit beta [Hazenella coriacea]TCS96689.1 phenylalanyl-tRNA synthetase beta subunit [Hazenella coriacea]